MLKSISQARRTVFEHARKINVILLLGLRRPLSGVAGPLPRARECLVPGS